MIIGYCKVKISAPWVTSLKEKRMVVKSIIEKTKHKFNTSIAEIESQDIHQTIVIGFSCVSNDYVLTEKMLNRILDFIEDNTDAILNEEEMDIIRV